MLTCTQWCNGFIHLCSKGPLDTDMQKEVRDKNDAMSIMIGDFNFTSHQLDRIGQGANGDDTDKKEGHSDEM